MITIELHDGQIIEVDGVDFIPIYSSIDFKEPDTRKGASSYQFTIPPTIPNQSKLNIVNVANNFQSSLFRRIKCKLFESGVYIGSGFLVVEDPLKIQVRFYFETSGVIAASKDLKVRELFDDEIDHYQYGTFLKGNEIFTPVVNWDSDLDESQLETYIRPLQVLSVSVVATSPSTIYRFHAPQHGLIDAYEYVVAVPNSTFLNDNFKLRHVEIEDDNYFLATFIKPPLSTVTPTSGFYYLTGTKPRTILYDKIFPAVKLSKMIEKGFFKLNTPFYGDLFDIPSFQRAYFALNNKNAYKWDDEELKKGYIEVYLNRNGTAPNTSGYIPPSQILYFPRQSSYDASYYDIYSGSDSIAPNVISSPTYIPYTLANPYKVRVEFDLWFELENNDGLFNCNADWILVVFDKIYTGSETVNNAGKKVVRVTDNFETYILNNNPNITVRLNAIGDTFGGVDIKKSWYHSLGRSRYVKVFLLDEKMPGNIIPLSALSPDITFGEILKTVCQIWGATLIEDKGAVIINKIDNVLKNSPYDATRLLDMSSDIVIDTVKFLEKYGQKSWFKYKNDILSGYLDCDCEFIPANENTVECANQDSLLEFTFKTDIKYKMLSAKTNDMFIFLKGNEYEISRFRNYKEVVDYDLNFNGYFIRTIPLSYQALDIDFKQEINAIDFDSLLKNHYLVLNKILKYPLYLELSVFVTPELMTLVRQQRPILFKQFGTYFINELEKQGNKAILKLSKI